MPSNEHDWGGLTLVVKDIKMNATAPGQSGTLLSTTELGFVDGVTAGTVIASKAVVADSSLNVAALNNLSMTGDLTVDGAVGTGTATPGLVKLTTPELTVVAADQLGRIDFSAPLESSGSDAILVSASIWAEAGNTFDATTNDTDIVFATGNSEAATEKMRLSNTGELTVTSAAAASLAVGRLGATTPAFSVDSSAGTQVAGLKVTGAATGGTVAVVATDSGADASVTLNAKGTGTIGIGSVSTGAVTITPATTVTGAVTPTGGIAAAGGFTARPSNIHSGGLPARLSTDGTDVTPSITEMYYAAVFIPCNMTITGVSYLAGTATEGNVKVGLFNSAGANVATSASTDCSSFTADTYNRVSFTGTYAAKGPATYYVGLLNDNTGNRFNAHLFGDFPASKTTGETYATGFTTISSPATTFTASLGPYMSLF